MTDELPTATQQDFFTVQHSEDYFPDWPRFYREALVQRAEFAAQHEHAVHLQYGEDVQQLLNVYRPDDAKDAPVLLFFHGGRWREGHPDFYDSLGRAWVEAGAVFVSAGYRKEPEWNFTDCCDDAVAAIRWVQQEIAGYGGDPERIVVAGHSSGGHIAAMATLTDWAQRTGSELGQLLGGVYMSAPVEFGWMAPGQPSEVPPSPIARIDRSPRHLVVSYGDPEPNRKQDDDRLLTRQGEQLVAALEDREVVEIAMLDTDHVASATCLGDPSSRLFAAVSHALFGAAAEGEKK